MPAVVAESGGQRRSGARRTLTRDLPWAWLLGAAHGLHGLLLAWLYPHRVWDADVLSNFVYFRDWLAGSSAFQDVPYFTVPKPLLVFVFGPLANVWAVFACSLAASVALGVVVYLVGRRVFGEAAGILLSLYLLLDVEKAVLTLTSSADLWVALFLFSAIGLALARRHLLAAVCLLLGALVKPVVLPCALAVLADDGADRRTRWLALVLPGLAVPLVLLSNHLLLGAAMAPARFFAGFDGLSASSAIGPGEVVHFVAWSQLARHAFVGTAPWGVLGLVLWVSRDRRRLASPFLLVPLLFVAGWVGLAVATPFVPYFRFFWPVQVWFAGFVIHGMLEAVRRTVRGPRLVRMVATAVLLLFLASDGVERLLAYRARFAVPFERAMAFVTSTSATLRQEHRPGQTVYTPLAFFPYLAWELGVEARPAELVVAESGEAGTPDWVLYVPDSAASPTARARLDALAASGRYAARLRADRSALLVSARGE